MRCPFAVQIGSPNFGYPRGVRGQNRPIAIVDHVMQGWLVGCDSWFRNPDSGASSHFGVGRNGDLHQYVDTDDIAWANGAINHPDPLIAYLYTGRAPGACTVSIEHEGWTGEAWTEPMYQTDLKLKRWIMAEYPDVVTLIGHYQLDSVDRRNCPGTGWPKERLLADLQEDDVDETTVKGIVDKALKPVLRGLELQAENARDMTLFKAWQDSKGTPNEDAKFWAFINGPIKWRLLENGWTWPG